MRISEARYINIADDTGLFATAPVGSAHVTISLDACTIKHSCVFTSNSTILIGLYARRLFDMNKMLHVGLYRNAESSRFTITYIIDKMARKLCTDINVCRPCVCKNISVRAEPYSLDCHHGGAMKMYHCARENTTDFSWAQNCDVVRIVRVDACHMLCRSNFIISVHGRFKLLIRRK